MTSCKKFKSGTQIPHDKSNQLRHYEVTDCLAFKPSENWFTPLKLWPFSETIYCYYY